MAKCQGKPESLLGKGLAESQPQGFWKGRKGVYPYGFNAPGFKPVCFSRKGGSGANLDRQPFPEAHPPGRKPFHQKTRAARAVYCAVFRQPGLYPQGGGAA